MCIVLSHELRWWKERKIPFTNDFVPYLYCLTERFFRRTNRLGRLVRLSINTAIYMSTTKDTIGNPDRGWKIWFYFPLDILDKTKLFPLEFCKTLLHHWNFHGQNQDHWKLDMIFSSSSLYSFLTNLWKFYMLFLWYPQEITGISKKYLKLLFQRNLKKLQLLY